MHYGDPEHLAVSKLEFLVHKHRRIESYELKTVLRCDFIDPPDVLKILEEAKSGRAFNKRLGHHLRKEPFDSLHVVTMRYSIPWEFKITEVRRISENGRDL